MLCPSRLLAEINRRFPEVWREADRVRAMKGNELPDWDNAVFLPIAAWYAITCELLHTPALLPEQIDLMQAISFAGAWRPSQDIIHLDPDVADAIGATPLEESLPAEVLWRLPAWCLWIDLPGITYQGADYEGFLAMLEEDANDGHRELRLFFLRPDASDIAILHIGAWSVQEALNKFTQEARRNAPIAAIPPGSIAAQQADAGLKKAVNIVLYVCAYGLGGAGGHESEAARPQPKKTKNGWRLFPPDQPKIHFLGAETGRQIRAARQASPGTQHGSHASPRPHIRRAHWHTYRKGRERRNFIVKWLPPIAVAMRDEE